MRLAQTLPTFLREHGYATAGGGKVFHPDTCDGAALGEDSYAWSLPYFHGARDGTLATGIYMRRTRARAATVTLVRQPHVRGQTCVLRSRASRSTVLSVGQPAVSRKENGKEGWRLWCTVVARKRHSKRRPGA